MNFKKRFAVILAIAGAATLTIHIINRVITLTSTMNNSLKTNDGFFYDWRFGKIYYDSLGEGSPILLVHDLDNCCSTYEWKNIVNELSKTNKVFTIDLLGCGRSDKPNITYTNFLYVQLLNDFIKDVIGGKTDIITTGTSASVAIMSALNYKDSINRMILINPCDIAALSTAPSKRTNIIKYIIKTPVIGTLVYNILNDRNKIEDKFITKYYTNPEEINAEDLNIYYESAHIGGMNAKYLTASLEGGYLNTNMINALTSIDNSIFIISSTSSPKYNEIANIYKHFMPSIEIVNSENTAQSPHLESPDEILEQIKVLFDL